LAKELVSIKGTREGLVIFFDPEREFEEIKNNLKHKIEAARDFFRGARFTLYQGNAALNAEQQVELENICRQYGLVPALNIRWPVRPAQNGAGERARLVCTQLRSGQQIVHSGNLVLVGDVHPGARIFASGDVVIMGRCRGDVHAGEPDNQKALVVALDLHPNRLTIAGVAAPAPQKSSPASLPENGTPQMALLENGKLIIRPYLRPLNG